MQTIRELRDKHGWTQQELAARAGVTKTAIHYWEAGLRVPGAVQLRSVARALGVSMDDIVLPGADNSAQPTITSTGDGSLVNLFEIGNPDAPNMGCYIIGDDGDDDEERDA